ncbi:MAG: TIGR01777 family protein [Candidatus Eremiobacteraeota bacterium]|uniref:Epimerase family protein n=1 Tax=mine drainage metagenome TaxID=410659 RepID=E6PFY9_9ZZZZ|nr:TIGR01777 family oxidoreductase [Candidatus Eremiobacteraeota bacterium]NNM93450.1 TIGR01777 family protein [Candidatus Eremiobacteraeota bacterium]
MRVLLLGGTGFIGKHLQAALLARGDEVVLASMRDPAAAASRASGCDVIVNLAGEPIAQRWNAEVKARLASSRVGATTAFLAALEKVQPRPQAFIAASAVGYYGTSESATFEESSPAGSDFLGRLCADWERSSLEAQSLGMRVALIRTGVVLGRDGGALAKLLPIFNLGLGGRIGNGREWLSWIHIEDQVAIYLAAIDGVEGPLNATAPEPVTNAAFTTALATALHRPAFFPVPALALHALLGEGAVVVLEGQRVLPSRTIALGYRFRFPKLAEALQALLSP